MVSDPGTASASAGGLAEDGPPVERADWSEGFPPGTDCGEIKSVKDPQKRARGVGYVLAGGASVCGAGCWAEGAEAHGLFDCFLTYTFFLHSVGNARTYFCRYPFGAT